MRRSALYAGVFLIAMATLMLEILLTRITSVIAWYHLAFFVISLGMLGMTLGAVLVYLMPRWFLDEALERRLPQCALGFALSTPVCVGWALATPMSPVTDLMSFFGLLGVGAALAIPFAWSGIALTLALTRAGLPAGLVYGTDLCGAAAGCLAIVPVLNLVDAPSAALLSAAVAGLSALAFGLAGGALRGAAAWSSAALFLLGLGNAASDPHPLRPAWVKGVREAPESFEYLAWNTYSRVTVEPAVELPPSFWARARNAPPAVLEPLAQRTLRIDGAASSVIAALGASIGRHAYLDWDISSVAHHLRPRGPAAVIGVGGGRDVLAAVRSGHSPVVGIELNDLIVELHRNRFRNFSGLLRLPGVALVHDEARSYLARDAGRYAVITMSLIDTWASTGAGAYSLSENGLYTREAWSLFVQRLMPGGIFTVSRWYVANSPGETTRMLALAMDTLFALGVPDPMRQIALIQNDMVSTLLLAQAPFSPQDLARLQGEARLRGYNVLVTPRRRPRQPQLGELARQRTPQDLWRWASQQPLDFSPPTDDRPFFFNMLKPATWLRDPGSVDRMDLPQLGNLQATQTLVYATLVSSLLTALTVALPMWLRRGELHELPRTDVASACAYFALIGLGFMFVEIGLLSRLNVFLGHPVLALSVLLGGIIFFTGMGSLLSNRVSLEARRVATAYPLVPALLVVAGSVGLVPLMQAFAGHATPVRIAVSLALLAPISLGLGLGFPLGLRLCERMQLALLGPSRTHVLGPWLWGINGACGVCASGLALGTSMVWGVSTTLRLGAACYALLPLVTLVLWRSGQARR